MRTTWNCERCGAGGAHVHAHDESHGAIGRAIMVQHHERTKGTRRPCETHEHVRVQLGNVRLRLNKTDENRPG